MDNSSIAAFIETNKTRMNSSVIVYSPSKGAEPCDQAWFRFVTKVKMIDICCY